MSAILTNFRNTILVSLVLAVVMIVAYGRLSPSGMDRTWWIAIFRWMHVGFGILWIGLLYYLNFVQVPTMPAIPAEQKGAITGHIAPKVFFFFRYAALLTVVTGLIIAANAGYAHRAMTFSGATRAENMIGLGMWLALIMAFNVWFIIWPAQKKILNLGATEASAEEKAKAAPRALYASRTNVLLSLPMLYCMANANINM